MAPLVRQCFDSWQDKCPHFRFVKWDELSFDVNKQLFTRQAYHAKKWAFVADYVRLFVLYNYGGVYLDMDVELLRPINHFLGHGAFTACEGSDHCVTGIMGSQTAHPWISKLLQYYDDKCFLDSDSKPFLMTNTRIITHITSQEYGWTPGSSAPSYLRDNLRIYPASYFCPKSWITGKIDLRSDTYAIHHFAGSWL
jgi:mannosyltransferase OCH1-like enzyme